MEKRFEKFLTNLSNELVKETYDYVKANDKLLFAKLCVLNFCDVEGFDVPETLKKIKNADEKKLVGFINPKIYDKEITSIEDIIKTFYDDMSNMDYFLWTYCYYNGHHIDQVYFENVENGNLDGVFEVMTTEEKIDVLSETGKFDMSMKSIYTDSYLDKAWKELEEKDKKEALINWF